MNKQHEQINSLRNQ